MTRTEPGADMVGLGVACEGIVGLIVMGIITPEEAKKEFGPLICTGVGGVTHMACKWLIH